MRYAIAPKNAVEVRFFRPYPDPQDGNRLWHRVWAIRVHVEFLRIAHCRWSKAALISWDAKMRYEPLKMLFSTADAEDPRIQFEPGLLRVAYRNWQAKPVVLHFRDVIAFSWDDGEAAVAADYRDDCGYIVHDSPWLARHRDSASIAPSEDRKHFQLGFNAIGVLQVLASTLEVLPELSSPK
jgi:hypothetical protein